MKKRLTNQDKQDTLLRRYYGYSHKYIKTRNRSAMKITCPKCKNSMPFHVSTTFTDRQTCEKCGYEIDLRDCKLYYWMRLFLALLGGVAVVIYGNDILAPYIADWTLRVFVLLLITLVLLLIVMYLVAPVFYNRTYVRKPSIGKKKKLGR